MYRNSRTFAVEIGLCVYFHPFFGAFRCCLAFMCMTKLENESQTDKASETE